MKALDIGTVRQAWQRVRDGAEARPQLVRVGLGLVALVSIYGWAKLREVPVRELVSGKAETEFHGRQIFDSSVAALYRQRDAQLAKNAHEYTDTVKVLLDKVGQLDKRLATVETGRPAAAPTPVMPPPTGAATPQANGPKDSGAAPAAVPQPAGGQGGGAEPEPLRCHRRHP